MSSNEKRDYAEKHLHEHLAEAGQDSGTWNEVIARNEQELRDLEERVVASRYKELRIWKHDALFTIRKGIPMAPTKWGIWTPKDTYFGNSPQEVLEQAALHGYADIFEWSHEWNDR